MATVVTGRAAERSQIAVTTSSGSTVPDGRAAQREPYFTRASLTETRYTLSDSSHFRHGRCDPPPIVAVAQYDVERRPVEIDASRPPPRGEPAVRLRHRASSRSCRDRGRRLAAHGDRALVGCHARRSTLHVERRATTRSAPTNGTLALTLPAGWTSTPASHAVHIRARRRGSDLSFHGRRPTTSRAATTAIEAVATPAAASIAKATTSIEHRDLETRYLYRPAIASGPRRRRQDRAGPERRLRDGRRRRGADRHSQLGAQVTLLSARIWPTADLAGSTRS